MNTNTNTNTYTNTNDDDYEDKYWISVSAQDPLPPAALRSAAARRGTAGGAMCIVYTVYSVYLHDVCVYYTSYSVYNTSYSVVYSKTYRVQ